MKNELKLSDVWDWSISRLLAAEGPWKLPVLATSGRLGPRARTVVARTFLWPEIQVYSDSRAGKVEDILSDPRVSLVYYDAEERIQIRLRGVAEVSTEGPEAEAAYYKLPPYSRGDYLTKGAPGSLRQDGSSEREASSHHFALIKIKLQELEWLSLRREGHLRASFLDSETGRWLVP